LKIELWQLFFTVVAYLGILFLVAYAAERGWIARRLLEHPLVYVLSLGVYATSWTYYGSVGLAAKSGYLFLTIYLGVTLTFIMAPILLNPILRLVREYQLTSLADLFAFRFRSPVTGFLVTMFMLIGILPYISLQIQAVVESIEVLTGDMRTGILAPAFCVTLTIFAILFGARHITPREKHEGSTRAWWPRLLSNRPSSWSPCWRSGRSPYSVFSAGSGRCSIGCRPTPRHSTISTGR
jgi:Na+/proline symporter